jgi:hypothetical protein
MPEYTHVIQENNLCLAVDGASECDPGLLPAAQRDSFLANLSLVAGVEQLEVTLKRTLLDDWKSAG